MFLQLEIEMLEDLFDFLSEKYVSVFILILCVRHVETFKIFTQ